MPRYTVSAGINPLSGKYRIDTQTGCWIWTAGCVSKGRPSVWDGNSMRQAHRLSYELSIGPIPKNNDLHHKCNNILCINPEHLETVNHNLHAVKYHSKTHCKRGHELIEPNIYVSNGYKRCKICILARAKRKYYEK